MADSSDEFDPESPEAREIGGQATRDRSDFLSLMGHFYRGELGRTTSWRTRIDRTTNWAVVLTATLLTWAFSGDSRPHYVLLVGMAMVTIFLGIEARRYRMYDIWRSRVRLLEENVFANALDPEGVEQEHWRELLSDDLRDPTIKTPSTEAVSRRLRRIYFPLLSVVGAAWIVRLAVFSPAQTGVVDTAAIGRVPGELVMSCVVLGYVCMGLLAYWPWRRRAKGELQSETRQDEWK